MPETKEIHEHFGGERKLKVVSPISVDQENTEDEDFNNNLDDNTNSNPFELIEENNFPKMLHLRKMRNRRVRNLKKIPNIKKKVRFKDLGTKIRNKRESLPMKLRALPSSFWQQPNQPANLSPAPLPPTSANCMVSQRSEDYQVAQSNINNTINISQTSTQLNPHRETENNSIVSDANTELLFSLFNTVDNNKKTQRRGRPKKSRTQSFATSLRDEDPCLVPSGLLSSLSPTKPQPDTPKTLNYSQLLNDLVFQL